MAAPAAGSRGSRRSRRRRRAPGSRLQEGGSPPAQVVGEGPDVVLAVDVEEGDVLGPVGPGAGGVLLDRSARQPPLPHAPGWRGTSSGSAARRTACRPRRGRSRPPRHPRPGRRVRAGRSSGPGGCRSPATVLLGPAAAASSNSSLPWSSVSQPGTGSARPQARSKSGVTADESPLGIVARQRGGPCRRGYTHARHSTGSRGSHHRADRGRNRRRRGDSPPA